MTPARRGPDALLILAAVACACAAAWAFLEKESCAARMRALQLGRPQPAPPTEGGGAAAADPTDGADPQAVHRRFADAVDALGADGRDHGAFFVDAYRRTSDWGRGWVGVRGRMLEYIGRGGDETRVDFLLVVALKDPHDELMASAGGALRHYARLPQRARTEIVEELIRKLAQIHDNATHDQTWEHRLAAVSDPWNTTLQTLTRQGHRTPKEWVRFWSEHRHGDWDRLPRPR